jgi:hypothetical protein
MASSIHIATGGAGYFAHNSRESKTTNSIFKDEKNYCSCSKDEAFKIYRSELEKRSEAYTNRTGQNLQKKAITHLSAIVNFEQNHDEKDIQKVCDYLEEKFDTKVIQFSLHRDEGHIDENGTAIKNYHAHIEMMGLDSEGVSVRKKLTKKSLSDMQTDVAELLEMERGRNFNKEFKEFKNGERDTMPTKAKRLDTYEFKAHKKDEAKQILAKNKDLTKEIAELRATLKEQGGEREDYAKLEALNKDLKAQIKAKDLTIEDLQAKVEEYRDVKATQKVDIDFLKDDIKELETKVTELEQDKISDKTLINDLESKNKHLNEELVKKAEKINSGANLDVLTTEMNEEIKEVLQIENIDVKKTYGIGSIISFLKEKYFEFKAKIESLTAENKGLKAQNELLKATVELHNESHEQSERTEVDDWWNKKMAESTEFGKPTENSNKIDEIVQQFKPRKNRR